MCPGVALEIKGIVEALAAVGTQVSLDLLVAPHVALQQLGRVALHSAHRAGRERLQGHESERARVEVQACLVRRQQGVLQSVTVVYCLHSHFRRLQEGLEALLGLVTLEGVLAVSVQISSGTVVVQIHQSARLAETTTQIVPR